MSDIRLTQEQSSAVHDRGGALLVSAAAGSGKTRVLVERLFSYMEQEGCHVDDFLIITYTNAAAAELRGKIARELSRRVAEQPDSAHLRRQMFRVYRSDIKTVDAFCCALLRENIQLLPSVEGRSLNADFRVLDQQEAALMRQRVLQQVLEDFYTDMKPGDELLAETLGAGRDDRSLETLVLELHEKIQSQAHPFLWLRRQHEIWQQLPEDLSVWDGVRELMEHVADRAEFWAERLERELDTLADTPALQEKFDAQFREAAASLRQYRAAVHRGWDEMCRIEPVFHKLGGVRKEDVTQQTEQAKTVWNKCKKEVRENLLAPFRTASAEHLSDLQSTAPAMLSLIELTERFGLAYQAEKVRRNCVDFSDQEHYAVDLLTDENGNPTELAEQVSARYREVMVDEYQDSNAVQDCIFRAVSDEGRKLFAVGDVKQSIYRFRLADPTIFLQKYLTWKDVSEAQEGEPRRVLLQKNFRSREEVLSAANFVFSNVMSERMGEMEYGETERLYPGAEDYLPRTDTDTEFHLINVENTEAEQFDRTQVEARFIARRIRQMLDEGYGVQDQGVMRPVRPEDIVVLMRSPRPREAALAEAMAREHIPFSGGEEERFFTAMEIAVMFSFLQIVDNPRQDVPLIAVLRSPLFGFTPDRLAQIRALRPEGDYYEALCLDNSPDTAAFLDILSRLRAAAGDLSADRLLWRIYSECGALAIFGAMDGGEDRKNRLIALFTYAGGMAAQGRGGLFDFVTHLRQMLDRGQEPPVGVRQSVGGVRLMSVHSSKGLEFPVVFLADLQKDFNMDDMKKSVLVHSDLGLSADCVDRRRHIRYPTLLKTAVKLRKERESKAEEMRILYVAMTRAKEKMILVDCMHAARTHVGQLLSLGGCPTSPEVVGMARSPGDWVLLPLLRSTEGAPLRRWLGQEIEDHVSAPGWQVHVWENPTEQTERIETPEEETPPPPAPFDPAPLERRYQHDNATVIPSKLTATQLKGRELDEEIAEGAPTPRRSVSFEKPRFLQKSSGLTAAERGTATHLVMQYLDFSADDEEAVRFQIAELTRRHLMTPEQAEAVDCRAIVRFLRSPLCGRIKEASQVYREYRFALLTGADLYDGMSCEEELLLQGVVDCAFDTPEGLVIVDFKTDHIRSGQEAERARRYQGQLNAYATALTRVLERPIAEKILYFFATGREVSL
ncbi:MAG: helicase-exonuclease AddAB subunit AddA [Oscillospiraceae bacterium]|nr:helicase-exonuclease AddAB subunit AddA [Oscillospiraceae bacterium]